MFTFDSNAIVISDRVTVDAEHNLTNCEIGFNQIEYLVYVDNYCKGTFYDLSEAVEFAVRTDYCLMKEKYCEYNGFFFEVDDGRVFKLDTKTFQKTYITTRKFTFDQAKMFIDNYIKFLKLMDEAINNPTTPYYFF